jgi:hypothetical protein
LPRIGQLRTEIDAIVAEIEGTAIACHQEALAHTEVEYTKFRTQQAAQSSEGETVFLETVKQVQKKIEGKSKPAPRSKKGQRHE